MRCVGCTHQVLLLDEAHLVLRNAQHVREEPVLEVVGVEVETELADELLEGLDDGRRWGQVVQPARRVDNGGQRGGQLRGGGGGRGV